MAWGDSTVSFIDDLDSIEGEEGEISTFRARELLARD